MQYDLNQLSDPKRFQRLVNAILTARFGEDARLTPLQGTDGGSDGETAPTNPYMEFRRSTPTIQSPNLLIEPPRPGRYLFQAKYHRTGEQRVSDLRSTVVREFRQALTKDVLNRQDRNDVNYFILVTNITSSQKALQHLDDLRLELLKDRDRLHADIWWGEMVTTSLDWSPHLWQAFPELFPGAVPPLLASAVTSNASGLPRKLRLAVTEQHRRDSIVKFRQVELEHQLLDLFVDLDFGLRNDSAERIRTASRIRAGRRSAGDFIINDLRSFRRFRLGGSALRLLLDDDIAIPRMLLEGGPGQGKSTITQMAAQVYREKLLGTSTCAQRDATWLQQCKFRIPIRLELRQFSEWFYDTPSGTLDQYVALQLGRDSGGSAVSAEDVHQLVERSSIILFLDGLDEVGNDPLRDRVLDAIAETIDRFERGLESDLRVVLTTRPPAVFGRWNKLDGFTRVGLLPLSQTRIDDYVDRWLNTQIGTQDEQERIRHSFNGRRQEPHVEALARNPMQLSVLLQFIQLKDEAFPDRRADLYDEYFKKVIDRDVLKSPSLRDHRELIEGLHSFLGFRLHGLTEAAQGRRSLNRSQIIEIAGRWLEQEGHPKALADQYFALGEERFGLIAALSGEGHETTYGFEIQPIQEYFAASFISNRLPNGMAHEVFGLLVHRDYWREVALFLAGLRRPNEKADLISRSRDAEKNAEKPWQQNGRAIVLQLLREGVFSQPQYLQREAMRFVLESLKSTLLPFNRTPDGLVDALSDVCRVHDGEETLSQILDVAERLVQSEDLHLLSLVHRLAAVVLPKKRYVELIWAYAGTSEEARALVRVDGPARSSELLDELSTNRSYWQGIAPPLLARRLWLCAIRNGEVPNISYPVGVHSHLVVQFAAGQLGGGRRGAALRLPSAVVPAIWQLQRNLQVIRSAHPSIDEDAAAGPNGDAPPSSSHRISWDDGGSEALPPALMQCLRDLIRSSDAVVSSIQTGRLAEVQDCTKEYLQTIKDHLEDPGIASWVACRFAIDTLQTRHPQLRDSFPQHLVDETLTALRVFYKVSDGYLPVRYFTEPFIFGTPLAVRLEPNAEPHQIQSVMARWIQGRVSNEERVHCHWLADIAIPAPLVKPLVESCRGQLQELLRFLGGRGLAGSIFRTSQLGVNDTRRVLRICRETDDAETLRGAASVLVNATFARLADRNLVAKILVAAPSSELVDRIFRTSSEDERKVDEVDRLLARSVAHLIVDDPSRYPFRTLNRAAAFLADTEPPPITPLFEVRPDILDPATALSD